MNSIRSLFFNFLISVCVCLGVGSAQDSNSVAEISNAGIFAKTNLLAWCIVPFDGEKRGSDERAQMLQDLGIKRIAYDYRSEHVPTFDAEIIALKKHGIELTAWWFPTILNDEARHILDVLQRHEEHPQLWVMGSSKPTTSPEEQLERIKVESARIKDIAVAANSIGSTVGLYNHGGWFGEPDNQIAIIQQLRKQGITNVGIVYNLHHGHGHLERFPALLNRMKPFLLVLNINGMTRGGDQAGKKILPVGQGDLDLEILKTVRASGWQGPIGILNHTDEDAAARLSDNMEGLAWINNQLDGKPAGPKPVPISWTEPKSVSD